MHEKIYTLIAQWEEDWQNLMQYERCTVGRAKAEELRKRIDQLTKVVCRAIVA